MPEVVFSIQPVLNVRTELGTIYLMYQTEKHREAAQDQINSALCPAISLPRSSDPHNGEGEGIAMVLQRRPRDLALHLQSKQAST